MDGGYSSPMPNPCPTHATHAASPLLSLRSIALLDKMPDLGLGRGTPGPSLQELCLARRREVSKLGISLACQPPGRREGGVFAWATAARRQRSA